MSSWPDVDTLGPGPAIVPMPLQLKPETDEGDGPSGLARHARAQGFVFVTPACAPPAPGSAVLQQHVALVVRDPGECDAAVLWVKQLARASPRTHLVFVSSNAWPGGHDRQAIRSDREAQRDDERLKHLIVASRLEVADAWLAALRVEARLRGRPCRDTTIELWAGLRTLQRRYEDAEWACRTIRSPTRRQALATSIAWVGHACTAHASTSGDSQMYVLHAIPAVLQLVSDADDELVALKGAASWARTHAGAQRVAFLGGEDARVVVAEGWLGSSLSGAERLAALGAREVTCDERGSSVSIVSPVRYGGAYVGCVVVVGTGERRETLAETARTLAALCAPALRARLDIVVRARQGATSLPEMIGRSPAVTALRDAVVRAASTPFPVLVEGESGTGKELVARALHRLSARRERRFAALNCAAIADELVEAELFGHTRGAFTGAVSPRAGLFEDAHGGTLFLDEVAELSPRAQAKLLRVLQEREVRRVGENSTRAIDVRVVAATNRSLSGSGVHEHFRQDLLFRLAVVKLRMPPLRERAEDIAPLATVFWRRSISDVDKRAVLGADALSRLAGHRWPGNVRELQNVIAGLAVLAPARGRVCARHVDQLLADSGPASQTPPVSLERARWRCEQQTVAAALARHAGRRGPAARELGLTRQGLTKAMRRLRIADSPVEGVA